MTFWTRDGIVHIRNPKELFYDWFINPIKQKKCNHHFGLAMFQNRIDDSKEFKTYSNNPAKSQTYYCSKCGLYQQAFYNPILCDVNNY